MGNTSLLGKRVYALDDKLKIKIPTLGEIRDDEFNALYYTLTTPFITTSTNFMVDLFDNGINFEDVSDWEICIKLISSMLNQNFDILFQTEKPCFFQLRQSLEKCENISDSLFFIDELNGIIINKSSYKHISNLLCKINFVEKEHRKFVNKKTLTYVIEREKEKAKRKKHKTDEGIDNLILAMVCDANFPYNFETINDITIYDFYASVRQIRHSFELNNVMRAGYSGMLDLEKVSPNTLNFCIKL